MQPLVKVHFSHRNRAPLVGMRERFAVLIKYGRDHPFSRYILVGAADEIHVVLASASAGQHRIAAPDWPGDHFRAAVAQFARHFRKKSVITNHHAQLAKSRLEHRILISWRYPGRD